MIYGIGTDIVAVSRLESALNRHGQRFAGRILADEEMVRFSEYAKPAQFLAKRFAAKEAVAKAFGTGFRDGLSLRHIIVDNDHHGRPTLRFTAMAQTLAERLGIRASHLSLSDEQDYAVAMVVLETAQ
ncbi:MAG: holo-ACP synthase [Gammaproteobacteria bacterium]|jgi:holo-[acyl-carrier protein] synthase